MKYSPDFKPNPAQSAYFDQQMATARDTVTYLVAYTRGLDASDLATLVLDHLSWEVSERVAQLSYDDEGAFGAAVSLLIVAVLALAERPPS